MFWPWLSDDSCCQLLNHDAQSVWRVCLCAGKEGHAGGMENMFSPSSLAETHISPDDLPYTDVDDGQ